MASFIRYWVSDLGSDDQRRAYRARKMLTDLAHLSAEPGKEPLRELIAGELASELNVRGPTKKDDKGNESPGDMVHTAASRVKVAYVLAECGRADAVPALVEAMKDLDVREPARFALDRNRSPEATRALIAILNDVGSRFRVGVIGALGHREGDDVLARLRKAATEDIDAEVRIAAVEVLANFPDPTNDRIIADAAQNGEPAHARRAQRARVRLAETLRNTGKTDAAADVYKGIESGNAGEAQKEAARIGLKASA